MWVAETPIARDVLVELGKVDIGQFLDSALIGQVGGAFAGIVGVLSHIAFIVAVGIYLAFDPEPYKRGLITLSPLHYRERAKEILDICNHQLAWWLIGRLVSMLAVAVIVTIGLWILGVPLAITLGLIAGLFSFVAILGPIVSVVPALLVVLLVSPLHIIWVMLLYMGAQAIEGYLITPVVQYRVVALPHAITLIAEIFGGVLFGLIGVTVATPMAVLLMALINMIYIEDILGDRTSYTDLSAEIHES